MPLSRSFNRASFDKTAMTLRLAAATSSSEKREQNVKIMGTGNVLLSLGLYGLME